MTRKIYQCRPCAITHLGQSGPASWLVFSESLHYLLTASDILKLVERAVEEIKRNTIGVASAHMGNEELDGGLGLTESGGIKGEAAIKHSTVAYSAQQTIV
jgi:hypothetical protein